MNRINVINAKPDARKKGLRMKVISIEVDDDGYLKSLNVEYTDFRVWGLSRIKVIDDDCFLAGKG